MLIQMSCPWCQEDLAVEDPELQADVRCDDCATVFTFADGRERERLAEAA